MAEMVAKMKAQKAAEEAAAEEAREASAREAADLLAEYGPEVDSDGEELDGEEDDDFDDLEVVGRVTGGIERGGEVIVELLGHSDAARALADARATCEDRARQKEPCEGLRLEELGGLMPPAEDARPGGPKTVICVIPKGRRAPVPSPIVGDHVRVAFRGSDDGRASVTGVLPRKTALLRRHHRDKNKSQTLCANVDLAVLVVSVEPNFTETMVDRVLVSAGKQNIDVLIVLNKSDLVPPESEELRWAVEDRLRPYERAGYEVLFTSAFTGEGIDELRERLQGLTSIFIGNSGVGKSHLMNKMTDDQLELAVGEISKDLLGRHTTTTTTLHRLPGAGKEALVIDSPGARRFSVWDVEADEVKLYWREFEPYVKSCASGICSHIGEPVEHCAVKAAVEAGEISSERYDRFVSLHDQLSNDMEGRSWQYTSEKKV